MFGKKFKFWVVAAVLSTFFSACQENEPKTITPEDPRGENYEISELNPLTPSEQESLISGQTNFACNLMSEIMVSRNNIVISPMSIYQAIALIGNGADENNAKEIAGVLGADEVNQVLALCRLELDNIGAIKRKAQETISEHESMKEISGMTDETWETLIGEIRDEQTRVELANALWLSESFIPYETFITESRQWLDAETAVLDFKDAAPTINSWFSRKTNGLIDHILSETMPISGPMIATNALYLNAKWPNPLQELEENKSFHNADGTINTIKTLGTTEYYYYAKEQDCEMLSMDLGINREFKFDIILPESEGVDSAEMLNPAKIKALKQGIASRYVKLQVPEFDVTTDVTNVAGILRTLGMKEAFTGKANFNRLCSIPGFRLDQIIHQAKIHFCESGVEAAAGTIVTSYGEPNKKLPNPYEFTVDRPFAWQITDSETGMILFCGVVNQL